MHKRHLPWMNATLTAQAVAVCRTEAVFFVLERRWWKRRLQPIVHIRPDDSSRKVRAAAIKAFRDICEPFFRQEKDGAIEIISGAKTPDSQFCLVTLFRDKTGVCAASAVIIRVQDMPAAQYHLKMMQWVRSYRFPGSRNYAECNVCGAPAIYHIIEVSPTTGDPESPKHITTHYCADHTLIPPNTTSNEPQ